MIKSKKGVVEIQFNWIFILIAGAVILIFFGYLVTRIQGTAEEKTSTTVLSNLDTILTGAGVSTGTLNTLRMPGDDIELSCQRFSIGSLRKSIESNVIFGPRRIRGKEMLTWTQEWSVPYRVTNFLYWSSPQVRYIFVFECNYDSSNQVCDSNSYRTMSRINNTIPEEFNVELRSTDNYGSLGGIEYYNSGNAIKDLNNYEVRFVFFDATPQSSIPPALKKMNSKDITALYIAPGTTVEKEGTIKFYKKGMNDDWVPDGETSFLKLPSLLGAIFSNDIEDYKCNMRKAFNRLVHVSDVYKKRSEVLDGFGANNCKNFHLIAKGYIGTIMSYAQSGLTKAPEIQSKTEELKQQNNLAELGSCVLIY